LSSIGTRVHLSKLEVRAAMGFCFSIMPFKNGFDSVSAAIAKAAERAGMGYLRGDHHKEPGVIMSQVIESMRTAEVVVADITFHNPNVMYELGIAHQLFGPERVVILTQSSEFSEVFDIHQFRQFQYSPDNLTALIHELPVLLKAARETTRDLESWKVIRGRLERTRHIAATLRRILGDDPAVRHDGLVIRSCAGLSSLAISDGEPPDPELGEPYKAALREERNYLRSLLAQGASLRAVLNPPRTFTRDQQPERLRARYHRLINLLELRAGAWPIASEDQNDRIAIRNCTFALSPVPMPNLLIVGNTIAYEGMKRGTTRGFEKTHCETDPNAVAELIADFERVYQASSLENERTHPPDGRLLERLRECLREAESTAAPTTPG
jgi:hypothetical protein